MYQRERFAVDRAVPLEERLAPTLRAHERVRHDLPDVRGRRPEREVLEVEQRDPPVVEQHRVPEVRVAVDRHRLRLGRLPEPLDAAAAPRPRRPAAPRAMTSAAVASRARIEPGENDKEGPVPLIVL